MSQLRLTFKLMLGKLLKQRRLHLTTFWQRLGERSTKKNWTFLQRQQNPCNAETAFSYYVLVKTLYF